MTEAGKHDDVVTRAPEIRARSDVPPRVQDPDGVEVAPGQDWSFVHIHSDMALTMRLNSDALKINLDGVTVITGKFWVVSNQIIEHIRAMWAREDPDGTKRAELRRRYPNFGAPAPPQEQQ